MTREKVNITRVLNSMIVLNEKFNTTQYGVFRKVGVSSGLNSNLCTCIKELGMVKVEGTGKHQTIQWLKGTPDRQMAIDVIQHYRKKSRISSKKHKNKLEKEMLEKNPPLIKVESIESLMSKSTKPPKCPAPPPKDIVPKASGSMSNKPDPIPLDFDFDNITLSFKNGITVTVSNGKILIENI